MKKLAFLSFLLPLLAFAGNSGSLSPSGGVALGQQIRRVNGSLFSDPAVGLYAPDGTTPWIDLSGNWVNFPIELDVSGGTGGGGITLIGGDGYFNGIGQFGNGVISIGDNSGSAGSWDASGNIVAASFINANSNGGIDALGGIRGTGCVINGNDVLSLFDGSAGFVYQAAYAASSGYTFDDFFVNQGQSSSGSSDVFLQTNGDGSNLTGIITTEADPVFTAWLATPTSLFAVTNSSATSGTVSFNADGQHETIYLSSGTTIISITVALPSATQVGQICRINAKSAVTTLTVTGTIDDGTGLSTLPAGGNAAYQAIDTSGTFIRIQ